MVELAAGSGFFRVDRGGAFAATVALAVMVYEGGVTLAGTTPGRATRLGPGEAAAVHRDGTLVRLDGPATAASAASATAHAGHGMGGRRVAPSPVG